LERLEEHGKPGAAQENNGAQRQMAMYAHYGDENYGLPWLFTTSALDCGEEVGVSFFLRVKL